MIYRKERFRAAARRYMLLTCMMIYILAISHLALSFHAAVIQWTDLNAIIKALQMCTDSDAAIPASATASKTCLYLDQLPGSLGLSPFSLELWSTLKFYILIKLYVGYMNS